MKVAIVGSRDYPLPYLVDDFVHSLARDTIVVSGGAPGVDSWAEAAAKAHGLVVVVYQADWGRLGGGAGMVRNSMIVEQADKVVAFWNGKSTGTRDTMRKAHNVDKLAIVYLADGSMYTGSAALTAVIGA